MPGSSYSQFFFSFVVFLYTFSSVRFSTSGASSTATSSTAASSTATSSTATSSTAASSTATSSTAASSQSACLCFSCQVDYIPDSQLCLCIPTFRWSLQSGGHFNISSSNQVFSFR
jgi:zona occludens toxin (predicted ATPase)